MRDARKPVIPLAVEQDEDFVNVRADGTVTAAAKIILSEEDVGRMKAGYVCAVCLEAYDVPFPKECKVCKFPMRDKQAEFIARGYKGNVRMGPTTSLADEMALMDELEARKKRELWGVSKPQILLPGKNF